MRRVSFALFLVLFSISSSFSASTTCPQHYLSGQAPDLLNERLSQKTQEVCYQEYALIHSGITRTALCSAEHLLPHASIKRQGKFHPDPNIGPEDRAELADYARSGFDRGHMAPSGDMSTPSAQQESFSLANMVPQDHVCNTKLWEAIESAVRDLDQAKGELYIVTGPIFHGDSLQQIGGRVMVPTHIFKAVYDPSIQQAAVYLVRNAPQAAYARISVAQLEAISGEAVFPGLPVAVKEAVMQLPVPKMRSGSAKIDQSILNDFK